MPSGSNRTVKATETSIAILETLHERGQAGVTELADVLGFSKGNVHKHLATLERAEFLVKRGDEYALSYRFLELGIETRRGSSVNRYADVLVGTLAESVGDTVFFAVEEHGKVVYVLTAEGSDPVGPDVEGSRRPLAETASGQVVLAFRDSDVPAASAGESAITEADLDDIRSAEIAIRSPNDEYSEIAVPVQFAGGGLIGVVGLFTEPRDHDELEDEYQRLLKSTGERLAKRIGWNRSAGDIH